MNFKVKSSPQLGLDITSQAGREQPFPAPHDSQDDQVPVKSISQCDLLWALEGDQKHGSSGTEVFCVQ